MLDNTVTRLSPGQNTEKENSALSDMFVAYRMGKVHEYPNDFDAFAAADWTQTLNAGTVALTAGDGGLLLFTTVVSNFVEIQDNPAAFTIADNFRTWFQTRLQVDNVLGAIIAGLINVTAAPFTPANITDGIYFLSDGTGALSGVIAVGGVKTTVALGTLVGGAQATLSFYWDGSVYAPNLGRIVFQIEGAGVVAKNRAEIMLPAGSAFPGATLVTTTLAVNATTAAIRTMTVDSVYVAKDRININATPAF